VDDGSTDNSLQILKEFERKDHRVKVLRHSKNMGVSCARNTAMDTMNAPHYMFLDSDDTYEPTICEKMLNALYSGNYDMAVSNVNIKMDEGMTYNIGYTYFLSVTTYTLT
jgi:glycosyltransferase involved in cell wall biosynthesis